MSPVEDEQVPLVCSPEVGDIYSVGTYFCFRMPDLRRWTKSVREAAASMALLVKPVTAEVRRVTLKPAVFHWRVEEARNGRAESMNANYAPHNS